MAVFGGSPLCQRHLSAEGSGPPGQRPSMVWQCLEVLLCVSVICPLRAADLPGSGPQWNGSVFEVLLVLVIKLKPQGSFPTSIPRIPQKQKQSASSAQSACQNTAYSCYPHRNTLLRNATKVFGWSEFGTSVLYLCRRKVRMGRTRQWKQASLYSLHPFCTPIKRIYYVENGNCPCRTSVKRFGNYHSK